MRTTLTLELFLPPADAAIWHPTGTGVTRVDRAPLASRVAGVLLIAASVGFLAVFAWLAQHFGYPDVLDRSAREVLPALHALGATGRAVWALYAVLPLLLIPAVAFAAPRLAPDADERAPMQLAIALQVVSSLAMTIGLARWSTLQWALADALQQGGVPASQAASLFALSDALNGLLGNALGEFVGELTLYGVFALFTWLTWRRGWRALALLGAATTAAGWVGLFRNITPVVDPVAAISNTLLPVYLIVLGGRLAWPR